MWQCKQTTCDNLQCFLPCFSHDFLFFYHCRTWRLSLLKGHRMLMKVMIIIILTLIVVEKCVISKRVCILNPSSLPFCTRWHLCWVWWETAWCLLYYVRRGGHGVWQTSLSYTWVWPTYCYSSLCHFGQWMQCMDGVLAPVSASSLVHCLR